MRVFEVTHATNPEMTTCMLANSPMEAEEKAIVLWHRASVGKVTRLNTIETLECLPSEDGDWDIDRALVETIIDSVKQLEAAVNAAAKAPVFADSADAKALLHAAQYFLGGV